MNNLFVVGDNIYLSLSDQDESTFGYATIAKDANSATGYQTRYLTTPNDHQYSLVGDMVVNHNNAMIYVPVTYSDSGSYNYTWLKYESNAINAMGSSGDYSVPADLISQFALKSASFFDDVIYANYDGHLIGFSEDSSNKLFQDDKLLLSWQDSFSVDKNGLIAINEDEQSIVRIPLDNKAKTQIGESFDVLANLGFEAMPKFTVYKDTIYILTLYRNGSNQKPYIGLCSIRNDAQPNNKWACKVSSVSLDVGNRLINLDADEHTGKIYFVINSLSNGTQLYVIN